MTIYFGADLHLEHKNILDFCDRSYDSVESMTESLLCDFEETVKPGDIVYLLGDIQFCNHLRHLERMTSIKGVDVHLIVGNHDNRKVQKYPGWASVTLYKDIKIDGVKIALSHYPIECWFGREHGTLHFHGHTHNNASHSLRYIPNRLDVGYDTTRRVLTSYEDLLKLMNKQYNYNQAARSTHEISY